MHFAIPCPKTRKRIVAATHVAVLILSLALIAFISYDTFANINFLESRLYMTFQFWVCLIFIAAFFIEFSFTLNRKAYFKGHWFFLLISIPYLNIINIFNIDFSATALYYIRYIPLLRGAYSLAMVVGAFSTNRAFSLLSQYLSILLCLVYLISLIFYYEERPINSNVLTYWDALYWACMNVTTIGSYITPLTPIGRILGVLLGAAGMMMLPLFTVFITAEVKSYNDRQSTLLGTLRGMVDADSEAPNADSNSEAPKNTPQQ